MKISIKQTKSTPQPVGVRHMSPKEECENQLRLISGIIANINRDLRKAVR